MARAPPCWSPLSLSSDAASSPPWKPSSVLIPTRVSRGYLCLERPVAPLAWQRQLLSFQVFCDNAWLPHLTMLLLANTGAQSDSHLTGESLSQEGRTHSNDYGRARRLTLAQGAKSQRQEWLSPK